LAYFLSDGKKTRMHSKARMYKMAGAGLAYLPMLVLLSARLTGFPASGTVLTGCAIFNLPAWSLSRVIQGYDVSHPVQILCDLVLLLSWSSLVACLFWKAVATFQGEDEPANQRGKFDWIGFQVRFAIGFVIGALVGWRFVAHTTSMRTLLIASIVTGCIGGMVFGLSQPPNFWSRP
jgi:hypothetical protein